MIGRAERGKDWAIVLSGGNGERMRPLIRSWLNEDRPKQYCTFVGTRSMLEHAVDRAATLVDPERILTVIGPGHRAFMGESVAQKLDGRIIEQPLNRGTAAAILLAAAYVGGRDSDATLLILPSDQYVFPEGRFMRYAAQACATANDNAGKVVLVGAASCRPETDYGWIEAGEEDGSRANLPGIKALKVKRFYEKPNRILAKRLLDKGGLWNTMVVAVKLRVLQALGWRYLPETMSRLEVFRSALRTVRAGKVPPMHEVLALAHAYRYMIEADFSRDILPRLSQECVVLPMEDVEWSDWGRPERVQETLLRMKGIPQGMLSRSLAIKPEGAHMQLAS